MYWNVPTIVPCCVSGVACELVNVAVSSTEIGFGAIHSLCQPKIHELRARLRQHDVARLQIAMHDSTAMRRLQARRDLSSITQDLIQRQRPTPQTLGQRLAFQQLHHEIAHAILRAHVMQLANVRMIQRRDGARLTFEALSCISLVGHVSRKNLDGNAAVEPGIAGAIHFAHAARSKRPENLVRPKPCAGRQPHMRGLYRVG